MCIRDRTYTDILSENGWICGISGKWHLGSSEIPQHGFSDWYVHQKGGGPYYNAPMIKNGELINEPGYITDAITNQAINLLDKYSKNTSPFYISVHYTAPHGPWINNHPKEILDYYNDCKFESFSENLMFFLSIFQSIFKVESFHKIPRSFFGE